MSDRSAKSGTDGIFHKLLSVFTTVYPGEAPTALLLTLNIFLIFVAYYIIKPVREALILAGRGAEMKSYLSAAIAVVLIFVVKAFSHVSSRFPRQKLITWVTLFFISNLVIFYALSFMDISLGTIGIIFFIWIGVFNVMVPAQFWGFANDIYNPEEGKRLFPIVAFGATFGAFFGSLVAGWLVEPLGLYQMMLVSGAILILCILLAWIIHLRETRKAKHTIARTDRVEFQEEDKEKPLKKGGGFKLVFKKKYLLYVAVFVLLLNFINTNGEFILGKYVETEAAKTVELDRAGELSTEEYIGKFYAGFFKYMNLFAILIQLFLVSRIFKWIGVRGALFVLPFIALGGYAFIAVGASLFIVKWVKVTENGTDYSLMNTTRHALFLITSREEKYKAKAAIDTFFHRSGDVLSAVIVFIGTTYLALNSAGFAGFNVILCALWISLGVLIAKEHKKLSEKTASNSAE
ncbi:MAG: Npt1/Npt2 family nucleotide transporter [Candidatus Aminicenantes bacterium]